MHFYSYNSLSFFFFLFSLFFKLGLFPFHQWSPDLLSGLNLNLMIYIHIFVKFGLLILFYNIHFLFLPLISYLILFGLFSMLFLALMIHSQYNIIR